MTLRHKILLLGVMALAGMFVALWLQYRSYSAQSQAIEFVARNVKTVSALSNAAHELQKERGLTTIQRSNADSKALAEQIGHTDAVLSKLSGTNIHIPNLDESLARLRGMAVAATTERLTIRDGYTNLLQSLIDEMDRLTSEPEAAVAKTNINAHIHLVTAKEYLGQIRATLGYWIEHKTNDPVVLFSLIRLKSLYDEELRKFRMQAAPGLNDAFAVTFSGQETERTMAILTQLVATGKLPQALGVQAWWSTVTSAIDRLKVVEDRSLDLIEQKAEGELAQLRNAMRFGVISILAAGLVVFSLAVSATISLLRALDRALASMERIASSQDFHLRIPADSPDEIGYLFRNFNQLLDIAERLLTEKDYLASTDSLTGISNRLEFSKVLRDETDRKRRHETPMALILLDVDHFKHINDSYGHNTGDEVLKTLTRLIGSGIRHTDFFARCGGEEFVLLLRDDGSDVAMAAAEKLRIQIASANFPAVGKVTCSFGVTAWEHDDTPATFVARADKALYASKRAGRNRVACEKGTSQSLRGREF